jgi:hypothetical protein
MMKNTVYSLVLPAPLAFGATSASAQDALKW